MKSTTDTLVPKLRFPEFRDESGWEYTVLSKVLIEHGDKSDDNSDVHSVSVHKGVINQVEHLGRSFAATDRSNYNLAKPYDIIYTKSPTGDFPYGIVKQNRNPYNVIVSPLYGVFSPASSHLGYILDCYFESPIRAKNYLVPITQKGAKNTIQISNATFLSNSLYLPCLPAEQQKIADCLSSLDDLISAENRKLWTLNAYKKGLMQYLFPQPGQTEPRLRFPEFRDKGAWEEEVLEKVFHLQDGFAFKSTDLTESSENATQLVRITEINNKNINENKVYVPNGLLDALILKQYLVKDGDLLLSLTGAAGFNFFIWDSGQAVLNQRTLKIKAKKQSDLNLTYLLEPLIYTKINNRGEGQNNNLSKEFLSKLPILKPKSDEQQFIANCLSSLDFQIIAQSQKTEALKQHKNGLMRQLFPNREE